MSMVAYDLPARRRLGRELREMRDSAEMALVEAALAVNLSMMVLDRLERGEFAATPPLARSLMRLYGQHDSTVVDRVLSLVTQAWQPGWWSDFHDHDECYLAWEASAVDTYEVATSLVPELLQTRAYAGTVWRGLTEKRENPFEAEQAILANLDVQVMRQCRLLYAPALRLHSVVTEAALREPVGGEQVMLVQWLYLVRVMAWHNVTLRVLPADAEVRTRSDSGWQVLEFADAQEPPRLFRKSGAVPPEREVSSRAAVGRAREQFDRLRAASLSPADSLVFLHELIDQTIAAHPVAARS